MRAQPVCPINHHDYPQTLKGLLWGMIGGYINCWQVGHLRVIYSVDHTWEHVSVSTEFRTPTWEEMEFVKRSFFFPHECVMQLHVPEHEHVNYMPYCLHLWRPLGMIIPRPPNYLVGAP